MTEEQLYFADGKLFSVLHKEARFEAGNAADTSGLEFVAVPLSEYEGADEAYAVHQRLAATLASRLKGLVEELSDGPGSGQDGEEAGPVETLSGTFLGIEQGDYFHWDMKTEKGEQVSFFIWETNEEIDKVMQSPEKYLGKKCQVTWQKATEDIPENGGKTEIEKILTVKWIK